MKNKNTIVFLFAILLAYCATPLFSVSAVLVQLDSVSGVVIRISPNSVLTLDDNHEYYPSASQRSGNLPATLGETVTIEYKETDSKRVYYNISRGLQKSKNSPARRQNTSPRLSGKL